jgi:translocation protein SEC62
MEINEDMDPKTRQQLQKLATFLSNSKMIRFRGGILNGARVDYFKGKHAITALAVPEARSLWLESVPVSNSPKISHVGEDEVKQGLLSSAEESPAEGDKKKKKKKKRGVDIALTSKEEAAITSTLEALVLHGFLAKVDKSPKQRHLSVTPLQGFETSSYFVLMYKATSPYHLLGSIGLVAVVLAGVMFPLWPDFLRTGVLYLSYGALGLLGVIFVLAIIRLILYVILTVVGKPGWLFPNLFADVGILESFQPAWEWVR